jgi:predicted nucleic acid-binding protein
MGGLDGQIAAQADMRFEDMLTSAISVILPIADDFNLAKQYLGKFETGLRAGDALHLAIARNHGAEKIYSLDKAFIKAGNMLGLPMSMGIQAA